MGAIQNRFTAVVDNLMTTSENLTASRSRIMDADFAAETANLSRAQILQQAGTAMVAQANGAFTDTANADLFDDAGLRAVELAQAAVLSNARREVIQLPLP